MTISIFNSGQKISSSCKVQEIKKENELPMHRSIHCFPTDQSKYPIQKCDIDKQKGLE